MAKKTKSREDNTITIGCANPSWYLKQMRASGVPEDLIKKLQASTTREMKAIKKHMEQDGWDLDLDHVKGECLEPVISSWFEWYVMSRILKKGYMIVNKKNKYTGQYRFVVSKEKKRDRRTNSNNKASKKRAKNSRGRNSTQRKSVKSK